MSETQATYRKVKEPISLLIESEAQRVTRERVFAESFLADAISFCASLDNNRPTVKLFYPAPMLEYIATRIKRYRIARHNCRFLLATRAVELKQLDREFAEIKEIIMVYKSCFK